MADYTPPGNDTFTATLTQGVYGSLLVEATNGGGPVAVAPAAATSQKVVGVAADDMPVTARVTVLPLDIVHEVPVASGVTLAPGDLVKAGAGGSLDKWAVGTDAVQAIVGVCLIGGTGNYLGYPNGIVPATVKARFRGR
jgi:hypothetical protein